jgi:hypothetical protein
MRAALIRQAVSQESLFSVLGDWCKEGAGKRRWRLRILSAFVSGKGILAISPLLDVFLADGNSVEIIFGIDRGGTDRGAISRLYALRRAYPKQASVKLFHAPAKGSIFHPKLYILDTGRELHAVLGSANLTFPGLTTNLESLLLYTDIRRDSSLGRELAGLWHTFAEPKQPLRPEFLQDLTRRTASKYARRLPKVHVEERDRAVNVKAVWEPLSHVPLPRSSDAPVRTPDGRSLTRRNQYLLMDVLRETRNTQMQIPLDVIERFFGLGRDQEADVHVSIVSGQGLTQPIIRPIVKSSGLEQRRLMRRLEMPQIKGMRRPLAVLFLRIRGKRRFAYALLPHGSAAWKKANRALHDHGQQGNRRRRYIVGRCGDTRWKDIRPLLNVHGVSAG